jgi:hypothetical protein
MEKQRGRREAKDTATRYSTSSKMPPKHDNNQHDIAVESLEQFRKLQQFVQTTDIHKLQEMYESGRLQQMLDPHNFEAEFPSDVEERARTNQPIEDAVFETKAFKDEFWNDFSDEEKLEIQKKLATYDSTLRSMLRGIRNGTISDEKAVQPILQNISESIDMKNLLKDVQGKSIKKIKVNEDVSVSLESNSKKRNPNLNSMPTDPSAQADYFDQVMSILHQNKNFDLFLKNVAYMESTGVMDEISNSESTKISETESALSKLSINSKGKKNQASKQADNCSCETTTNSTSKLLKGKVTEKSPDMDSNLMDSIDGLQEIFDANLESTIMSLCEQDMAMLPDFNKQELRKKLSESKPTLSAAGFVDYLKKCENSDPKEMSDMTMDDVADMATYLFQKEKGKRLIERTTSPFPHDLESLPDHEIEAEPENQDQIDREYEESLAKNKELQEEKQQLMQYQEMLMKQQSNANKNMIENEYPTEANPTASYQFQVTDGNPTPEQRQQLQRECLNRLFAGDASAHDEQAKKAKKKKNKKKKKGGNSTSVCGYSHANVNAINHIGVNNPQNDTWLCELCEYKIVYGELPVFLSEWLMRKSNQQEKMENYQRYLMSQRNDRHIDSNVNMVVTRPQYVGLTDIDGNIVSRPGDSYNDNLNSGEADPNAYEKQQDSHVHTHGHSHPHHSGNYQESSSSAPDNVRSW